MQTEAINHINLSYQGWSGLFAFPYRIQAQEDLSGHEVSVGTLVYRVYAPFLLRPEGSPITDDVPRHLWPNFEWHPDTPDYMRGEQVAPLTIRYGKAIFYDGIRADIVGVKGSDALLPFVRSSMRWLRLFSNQPWISDIDHHVEPTRKRIFMIDAAGKTVGEATPVAEMLAITTVRLVTNQMWRAALEAAASGREVPVYWNLFFDAMNARGAGDFSRAVMNLAMALESCRDQNFSRLHPMRKGRGPKLRAPFDHSDLLSHLSKDAKVAFNRDFSAEQPRHWPSIKNLYVCRHHVAHGRVPGSLALTEIHHWGAVGGTLRRGALRGPDPNRRRSDTRRNRAGRNRSRRGRLPQ